MSDEHQKDSESSPVVNKAKQVGNDSAMAVDLPFTFAGAILLAGGLGYFLDRWLHTKPILMLVLGGIGFIAGIREVMRRLPG